MTSISIKSPASRVSLSSISMMWPTPEAHAISRANASTSRSSRKAKPRSGRGYLDDGTMVVCENAAHLVGKEISVIVTSVLKAALVA